MPLRLGLASRRRFAVPAQLRPGSATGSGRASGWVRSKPPFWGSVLEKTKAKTLDALLRLTPRTAPAEEALGELKRFAAGRAQSPSARVLLTKAMLGRLTRPQVLFAAILGIAGGMYIYQPIFEQYSRDQKELQGKLKLLQESEEKRS